MSSNTAKGPACKGSKYLLQTLINSRSRETLSQLIRDFDSSIGDLEWLSPFKNEDYVDVGLKKAHGLENESLSFWPSNRLGHFGVLSSRTTWVTNRQ